MPPDDPTPLGDAMTHRFPDQKIPEPKPGPQAGEGARSGDPDESDGAPDIEHRPALPDHPKRMPADSATDATAAGPSGLDRTKPPGKQRG